MESGESKITDSPQGNGVVSVSDEPTPTKIPGKRGRPPGGKNRQNVDTGAARVESGNNSSANNNSLETAKFVGAGAVALLELVESFVHSGAAKKIERRMPSKLEEFKDMAKSLGLKDAEKELLSTCAEKIAVRYDVLTKYGIEAVALVTLAQYSIRQMSLLRFVENITKQKPNNPTPQVTAAEVNPQGA